VEFYQKFQGMQKESAKLVCKGTINDEQIMEGNKIVRKLDILECWTKTSKHHYPKSVEGACVPKHSKHPK
jgi:hypothetical protein